MNVQFLILCLAGFELQMKYAALIIALIMIKHSNLHLNLKRSNGDRITTATTTVGG